ncbi:hypothetical protein AB4028_15795 [Janibacter sp. RAF20_2_2]|uniref:hypothetical protein n=1 Tax=unclassified Janibacter TaxID=2649294 RepID=UPI003F928890
MTTDIPALSHEHNEHTARRLIDRAIAATPLGDPVPKMTARLIAAAIHGGPGTALATFAATGVLDQPGAITELNRTSMDDLPSHWWFALDTYLRRHSQVEVRHG